MEFEDQTVQNLRALAKERGLKIMPNARKSEIIEKLKTQEVMAELPKRIAIHVSTGPVLVPGVGIFNPGYHIIDADKLGMIHSKRVRLASAGEVASYYGGSKI